MPIGGGAAGGVGTGYVKIKPDAQGFGADLEKQVGSEATNRSGALGKKASAAFAGAFAAGTAAMAKGVFDFAGFDAGMREVFTLMPDITAPAMDEMTAQVKSFAGEFGVLPDEVIPSLYNSISAGVPPDNVFEFLETAQQLARGGATDLATAVDGLSSVVNAYGPEALSAAEASDALFTAVKLGKTTVDEMSGALYNVAPIAASFGVGFDEVAASIATVTAQGTPTSVATTQMASALAELGKAGTKTSDLFAEVAGKTFPQFIEEGGTMTEALALLGEHAEEAGLEVVDLFGSKEAGLFAAGLLKDLEKTNANLDALGDSAGATEEAFEVMNEGLAATMDRLKARLAVAFIGIGEAIAPTVEVVGMFLADLLTAFNALPGPMQAAIVMFATVGAGIFALAGPILKAVKVFGMLGKAMSALAMNPWMLAVLALIAVTYLIITHWEEVQAFLSDLWEWIEDTAGAVADFFVDLWETVSGAVVDAWEAIVDGVTAALDAVVDAVETAWDAVTGATVDAWNAITGAIETAWEAITGAVETAIDAVQSVIETGFAAVELIVTTYLEIYRTIFETAWNTIRTVVETAVGAVTWVITNAMEGARIVVETAWNLISSTTSNLWNGIRSTVETAISNIIGNLERLISWPGTIVNAFASLADGLAAPFRTAFEGIRSAWNSTVGGFSVGIPGVLGFGGVSFTIPSMALGGVVSDPMLAMIGDAGRGNPEIVTPENLMRDVVTGALMDAGGAGLHVETHLHAEAGVDVATLERMLERASTELVRVVVREVDRNRLGAGQARGALVG